MEKLAILGGTPVFGGKDIPEEMFRWPIITEEDEAAVLDIVRRNAFSYTDITRRFEKEFAAWQGRKYAVAFPNGTMSLSAAMFAIGLGAGDEIICPTKTYWASVSQAGCFGASAVFCNINEMLSMDPADLERCITPRTKAIMVVHYCAYPCDMDAIMEIAKRHNLYVIEDVSHAHGSMYKGKKCGTFGHIAAMSMMSEKSFAAGELGIAVTDDVHLYERALAYGHYERNNANEITQTEELKPFHHIALGGVKARVNQVNTALALGQLKHYDERAAAINRAMNEYFDLIEDIPGLKPLRCDTADGSYMGAFYGPRIIYDPAAFEGLSAKRFAEALNAEYNGECYTAAGGNFCLHTHQYFKEFDFFHMGKPTRIAFNDRDVREGEDEALAISVQRESIGAPPFKRYMPELIAKAAAAIRKVADNYKLLLEGDTDKDAGGLWYGKKNEDIQQKK